MFKKLFKKTPATIEYVAPLTGKVVPLEQVPDEVFSQKMMGDGLAIEPTDNQLVSPVDGEIVDVFKTKHAISFRGENGAELLIHMGLDTVQLDGKGFTITVENGQKVKKGDPIGTFDIQAVTSEGYKTITPLILLNGDEFHLSEVIGEKDVIAGEDVLFKIDKK